MVKATALLAKPFDFTVDETFEFQREKAPWAANEAELDELWRKRIKNDVLSPEVTKVGLGDVVDERFARGVAQQVEAAALPRAPAQAEVFNRSFLPVRDQRLVK